MKERLQLLLQNNNISASKLAEMLEVQPSGISHILSGRNNPSMEFIVKCLNAFPDINPEWFIMGTGPMYKSVPTTQAKSVSQSVQQESSHNSANNVVKSTTKSTTNNGDNFASFNTLFDAPQSIDFNQEQQKTNTISAQVKNTKKQSDHTGERIASGIQKKITKVMIFYSDRTVESFDSSE